MYAVTHEMLGLVWELNFCFYGMHSLLSAGSMYHLNVQYFSPAIYNFTTDGVFFSQPNEGDCEQSCDFMRHIQETYPGQCPAPREVSGFETACIEECELDRECKSPTKCCHNGCGYVCVQPKELYLGRSVCLSVCHS